MFAVEARTHTHDDYTDWQKQTYVYTRLIGAYYQLITGVLARDQYKY